MTITNNDLAISDAAISSLRGHLAGSIATPGEPEYDGLCQPWNSTARQRPALVVAPAAGDDVAVTVRFAAAHGLRVAVQATGHGAAGTIGDNEILLNMRGLDEDAPGALEPANRERLRELRMRRDPNGRLHRARDLDT